MEEKWIKIFNEELERRNENAKSEDVLKNK